ncbi:MAG: peptidylprolyl isomerase [Dehalococcoidia bacterium]|nr:peptidylprolyl isomerase [Dehalococcoidia bacterium]
MRRSYSAPPPMTIDPKKKYEAVISMKKGGQIRLELLPEAAPNQTNNFVFLAKNHFYDGLTFHRVLPGFVAQGGDPLGTGFGGSGYTLPPDKNGVKFDAGVISMASNSAGVSGAQFFITLAPTPTLEATFAAFGRVTQGMDVVRAITQRDPSRPNQPPADVIDRIEIVEGN